MNRCDPLKLFAIGLAMSKDALILANIVGVTYALVYSASQVQRVLL